MMVVLLAREPLLLRGGDDLAVHDERRGGVVVERRNTENPGRTAAEGRICPFVLTGIYDSVSGRIRVHVGPLRPAQPLRKPPRYFHRRNRTCQENVAR